MKKAAEDYFLKKLHATADVADRVVNRIVDQNVVKRIHLTGICGKAMASLAGLLVRSGYIVTGSEEHWNPPMSTVLEHLGIFFKPFSIENLEGIDLLVMGNAYSSSNIEAVEARAKGIPQISSAEAYRTFFIENKTSIVIAGTHGKTTTSGLAGHVFIESGKKTNVLVGGVLSNIGESYHYGGQNAEYSIVEGDEYDTAYFDKAPKFLHYKPTIGVITSIEFDHADIYDDIDDYLAAFVFFAGEIPSDGYVLLNDAIKPEYQDKIRAVCSAPVYTYGFGQNSDIRIINNRVDLERDGQVCDIDFLGTTYTDFFIPLFGLYNLENTLSIIAIGLKESITESTLKQSLATFTGTEQRQQVLYDQNDIVVISDFAHHPTAVARTIEGVRDHYPTKRLIAIFEPRSVTSRRKDFEERYGMSFSKANIAYISTPPIRAVDDAIKMMDIEKVAQLSREQGVDTQTFTLTEDLYKALKLIVQPNDVLLIMSNGTFDGLAEKVVTWLETR